jgi:DNA-binding response OmpR family regulator
MKIAIISLSEFNLFHKTSMPKEKILILDEERYVQLVFKTLLEGENYTVIAVNTIGEALRNFLESEISGLITEYWIHQTCSLEAIRDLKKRFPELYVMMLTNDEVQENKYKEIINAGVDDLFQKPFPSEKILVHLKKGLRQREILLRKNRLEQEFYRIKRKWYFQLAAATRERRSVR